MVVDNWRLSITAFQLFREFKSLIAKAKLMAISCWVKWQSFPHQLGAKELQKHPTESHEWHPILFWIPDKYSLAQTGTIIGS